MFYMVQSYPHRRIKSITQSVHFCCQVDSGSMRLLKTMSSCCFSRRDGIESVVLHNGLCIGS